MGMEVGDIVRLMLPNEMVSKGVFTQKQMNIVIINEDEIIDRCGELFSVVRVTETNAGVRTAIEVADADGNVLKNNHGAALMRADVFEVVQCASASETECCYDLGREEFDEFINSFVCR